MKKFYSFVLFVLCFFISEAQTQLLGGSNGNGDFENGSTGWVLVNGTQTNKWVVSNNATPGFTGNCIYISSSATAPYSHTYNTASSAYSYFYKDVAIPAGTTTAWLVFDYIVNGQVDNTPFGPNAKDALRIWTKPTSIVITAGEEVPNIFISAGAGYYNQGTWKRRSQNLDVTAFAGGTMRLIFQWFNDGSLGTQPPVAIDNIEMYTSCQQFLAPSIYDEPTALTATLVWSPITAATGYDVRWKKLTDPTTVSTYANPHFLTGGNTFSWQLENLTPATTYICEMRPTGLPCTEWSTPLYFTTLTPPPNDVCSGAYTLSVESNACGGTLGTFRGTTPSAALPNPCANGDKLDVWYKFTAAQAKQVIQTTPDVDANGSYTAKNIRLYTGTCDNLIAVAQPCAVQSTSIGGMSLVSRVIADGLTPGDTYYIRVTSIPPDVFKFRICVYNEPPLPQCPELLTPANNSTLNFGIPQEFKWKKGTDAVAYKLKIIQQNGAYTEINTTDTSYMYTLSAGINYTWNVTPYNIFDQFITCSPLSFSVCPATANTVTITATGSTDKCLLDSVKLTASSASNVQWFLNNQPVAGATSDIFWAKLQGTYSVRVLNGSCYSDLSNTITINNLPTPVKPSLVLSGPATFCQGGLVTLTSSLGNIGNQWFMNQVAIPGANGSSFATNETGLYYLRVTNSSSGCNNYSDTVSITVNPLPAIPTITAGGATSFCQGGSVVLTSSAATGNQWKLNGNDISGATGTTYTATTSGNYTVVAIVNGCPSPVSSITTVTVNPIPSTPAITAGGPVTICSNGSVTFTSNAASSNQWYNGTTAIAGATNTTYTANAAGVYSVKVTQNGCTSASSNTFTVVVNTPPAVPTVSWNGTQLSTAAGSAGYQWFLNGASIAGATNAAHTPASSGLYKVTITDANGCTATSTEFNLVATGINDIRLNGVLYSISPNPAKDDLFIKVQGNNPYKVEVRIISANGAEIMKKENLNQTTAIPVKHLATGVYYVMLTSKKEKATFKIVINH